MWPGAISGEDGMADSGVTRYPRALHQLNATLVLIGSQASFVNRAGGPYTPAMAAPPPPSFVFVGNHRLLDFLNTEVAVEGTPRDLLASPADLMDWLEQAGA